MVETVREKAVSDPSLCHDDLTKDNPMKSRLALSFLLLASVLVACLPSLKPFYTEQDLVTDLRIVGKWKTVVADNNADVWDFSSGKGKAYTLIVTERDGKPGKFTTHFFKLQGLLFLDLMPSETELPDKLAGLVIPGHLLFRVTSVAPELKLVGCDVGWLDKHLTANPGALSHYKTEEGMTVLTAETKDLQAFVLSHLKPGELFLDPDAATRLTNSAPIPAAL